MTRPDGGAHGGRTGGGAEGGCDEALAELAARHGVDTAFRAAPDRPAAVSPRTVVAVLGALGVDATTPGAVRAALDLHDQRAAARLLPPCTVVRAGTGTRGRPRVPEGTALTVTLEDGGDLLWDARADLPPGRHVLTAHAPDGRTHSAPLIVAPPRLPGPPRRAHGFMVQLYSLLSERSWGMGDLGDLADLASWAGRRLGSDFLQINPLHAAVPGAPTDPSPYRPSSRRFADPVHLRVEDVPEFARLRGADRERAGALLERADALRASVLHRGAPIDRDAVWALKKEALRLLRRVPPGPGRTAEYHDFLAEQGRALDDHATWCALAEVHGPDWRTWPRGLRDPRSPQTARARREHREEVDLHRWLAWLTHDQLVAAQRTAREAGMAVGVVHDLAVGVHPHGSDAWALQDAFAAGMSVGAPPDAFSPRGQDWGLPPWRPDALADLAYAPYGELLRGLLRYAGGLRVDHVMGLFRLWWVPEGRPPTEGTYVRYDAGAMLGVLALEAHRAGAVVVGEDLGTVEPGVRGELADRGVLGTSVLWFERDHDGGGKPLPPEAWRADCLATATTHDLPSTAARLTGEHVALRHRLGLLSRPLEEEQEADAAEVAEWLDALERLGLLSDGRRPGRALPETGGAADPAATPGAPDVPGGAARRAAPGGAVTEAAPAATGAAGTMTEAVGSVEGAEEEAVLAVHRFLLRTPARMVGIWLPDAVGDRRPQNVPGTCDEYPNWRLPIADALGRPVTLEQLAASPRLKALVDEVR